MKLKELPPVLLERIGKIRYDSINEKHEGPFDYATDLEYGESEFIEVEGRWVLFPIETDQHPNITILRTIVSADGRVLTIFLQDTTVFPADDWHSTGFLAVCEQIGDENIFVATVYHEWFIFTNDV